MAGRGERGPGRRHHQGRGVVINVAAIVGGVLALFVIVAALLYLSRRRGAPPALGRPLRLVALGLTLGIVVALLPDTVSDNGAATGYLLGVPVVAALLPLAAGRTRAQNSTSAYTSMHPGDESVRNRKPEVFFIQFG